MTASHGFRRAASIVDKILKGASPALIPVEQPTKFELVINRTTARELRFALPETLLVSADDVYDGLPPGMRFYGGKPVPAVAAVRPRQAVRPRGRIAQRRHLAGPA